MANTATKLTVVESKPNAFASALKKSAKVEKKKSAKKSTAPTVEVAAEVKKAADAVVRGKKLMKEAKGILNVNEPIVIDAVKAIQDKDGFAGNHRKSYDVPGEETDGVKFVSSNRFSINGDDNDDIHELVGDAYHDLLEEKFNVTLKAEVFDNPEMQDELMALIGDNFDRFFETKATVKVKDDFDKNIYKHVDADDLDALRIFVKQYKPSLR